MADAAAAVPAPPSTLPLYATFWKNADTKFSGCKVPVDRARYKNLKDMIQDLSKNIFKQKIYKILALPKQTEVKKHGEIKENGKYVCTCTPTELFKKMKYSKLPVRTFEYNDDGSLVEGVEQNPPTAAAAPTATTADDGADAGATVAAPDGDGVATPAAEAPPATSPEPLPVSPTSPAAAAAAADGSAAAADDAAIAPSSGSPETPASASSPAPTPTPTPPDTGGSKTSKKKKGTSSKKLATTTTTNKKSVKGRKSPAAGPAAGSSGSRKKGGSLALPGGPGSTKRPKTTGGRGKSGGPAGKKKILGVKERREAEKIAREEEENAAAVKIQASWRGHNARKKVKEMKASNEQAEIERKVKKKKAKEEKTAARKAAANRLAAGSHTKGAGGSAKKTSVKGKGSQKKKKKKVASKDPLASALDRATTPKPAAAADASPAPPDGGADDAAAAAATTSAAEGADGDASAAAAAGAVDGGLSVPGGNEAQHDTAHAAGTRAHSAKKSRGGSARKTKAAGGGARSPSAARKSPSPSKQSKTSKKTSKKTGKPTNSKASKASKSKGKGQGNGKKGKDAEKEAAAERPVVHSLIKKSEMRLAVLPPDVVVYKPLPPSVPEAQKPWSVELSAEEYNPLEFTDKAFKHSHDVGGTKSAKKGKKGKRGKSSAKSRSKIAGGGGSSAAGGVGDGSRRGSDAPVSHGANLDPSHAANPVASGNVSRSTTNAGDDQGVSVDAGGAGVDADGVALGDGAAAADGDVDAEPVDPEVALKAAKAAAKTEKLAAAQKAKEDAEALKAAIAALPWYDEEVSVSDTTEKKPQYNTMDGHVNRISLTGEYAVAQFHPLNPKGRQNLKGRGVLPRHGPNHAMVSIITRIKRKGRVVVKDAWEQPILEYIMITRTDGSYVCPGGLVPDLVTARDEQTSKFLKEILHARKMPKTDRADITRKLNHLFNSGAEISAGFAEDDARNTDNAWVELTVTHYHDETGEATRLLKLEGGHADKGAAVRAKSAKPAKVPKSASSKSVASNDDLTKDIPAGSAVWVEMTPSIELAGGEEELLMAVREDVVAKMENVSGKKRRTYFKKWNRLRNYMQDKLKMDRIAMLNPGNHAVRHFNEKQYKRLNDEHQRAFMRCIGPAVRYPNLSIGCYAHNAVDYTDFPDYFSNVVSSYCGMEEAESKEKSARLDLQLVGGGPVDPEHASDAAAGAAAPTTDRKTGMKSKLDFAKLGLPFVFIRIEAIRNFELYPLSPAMSRQQRTDLEDQLVKAFELLQASTKLKGTYYSLTPGHPNFVDGALKSRLASSHPSFPVEKGDNIDRVASSNKDWPAGRGCYIATDTRFSITVGGKDHINLALHQKGRNLGESLIRAEFLVSQLADAFLTATGQALPGVAGAHADDHSETGAPSRKTSQHHTGEHGADDAAGAGAAHDPLLTDDEKAAQLAATNARKEVRNALWHSHPRFGKISMLPLRCGSGFLPSVTVPLPNSVITDSASDEEKEEMAKVNDELKIKLVMEDSGMATITPISHFAASEFMLCEQLYSAVKELKRLDASKSKKGRAGGSVRSKVTSKGSKKGAAAHAAAAAAAAATDVTAASTTAAEHGSPDKKGSDRSSKSVRSSKSSNKKSAKSSDKKTPQAGGPSTAAAHGAAATAKPGGQHGKKKRLSPARGGPKKPSAKKKGKAAVGGKTSPKPGGKAGKAPPKSPPKLGAEKSNVLPPIGGSAKSKREASARFPKDPANFPNGLDAAGAGAGAASAGAGAAGAGDVDPIIASVAGHVAKSATFAGLTAFIANPSPPASGTKKLGKSAPPTGKGPWQPAALATPTPIMTKKSIEAQVNKEHKNASDEDDAAKLIQKNYRSFAAKKKQTKKEDDAARVIQRSYRKHSKGSVKGAPAATGKEGAEAAASSPAAAAPAGGDAAVPAAAPAPAPAPEKKKGKGKDKGKKKKKKKASAKTVVPPIGAAQPAAIAV